jgi:hypothetical protein
VLFLSLAVITTDLTIAAFMTSAVYGLPICKSLSLAVILHGPDPRELDSLFKDSANAREDTMGMVALKMEGYGAVYRPSFCHSHDVDASS